MLQPKITKLTVRRQRGAESLYHAPAVVFGPVKLLLCVSIPHSMAIVLIAWKTAESYMSSVYIVPTVMSIILLELLCQSLKDTTSICQRIRWMKHIRSLLFRVSFKSSVQLLVSLPHLLLQLPCVPFHRVMHFFFCTLKHVRMKLLDSILVAAMFRQQVINASLPGWAH